MPNKPNGPNELTPLIRAAADADPDGVLIARARDLANTAMDRAFFHLEHGTPTNELAIIKLIAPVFTKLLETKGENEELAEMRELIAELRVEVLGHDADVAS